MRWTSSRRRLAAKPILRSSGRFSMRRPMAESRVVLLDAGLLVSDVQRRHHAVGDDTGAEPPRRAAAHLAVEHQAHLAGAADIEVLADTRLEEDEPRTRLG